MDDSRASLADQSSQTLAIADLRCCVFERRASRANLDSGRLYVNLDALPAPLIRNVIVDVREHDRAMPLQPLHNFADALNAAVRTCVGLKDTENYWWGAHAKLDRAVSNCCAGGMEIARAPSSAFMRSMDIVIAFPVATRTPLRNERQ